MTVHRLMLVFVMFVMFGGSAAAAPWPEASGRTDGMPVARSAEKKPAIRVQQNRNNVVLKVTNPTSVMAEPLPTSRVVSQLDVNAPVTLIDQLGDWLRVATPTGLGWIQRRSVELPRRPAIVTAQRMALREPATIYRQPSLAARSVESRPLQSAVMLVEDGGDWLRLRTFMNNEGWLQRSFVVASLTAVVPPQ